MYPQLEGDLFAKSFTFPNAADFIWASSRENLSSGFPTKRDSNQPPQLQRLAIKLKFHLKQVYV